MGICVLKYVCSFGISFKQALDMFYKGEVPFVRLLVPLVVGILFAWFWPEVLPAQWGMGGLLITLILFAILMVCYQQRSLYRRSWILGGVIHVFLLLLGYVLCLLADQRCHASYFTTDADAFLCQITTEPKLTGSTIRFQADVIQGIKNNNTYQTKGQLAIAVKLDSIHPIQLFYGDLLLVPPTFKAIDPPFNPAEFDFRSHWAKRGVYYQTFVGQRQLSLLKQESRKSILFYALQLRRKLVQKFNTYLPDQEAASLASTLLLGYRVDLDKEIVDTYSQTGTMHVLAVSGMHVGIIFLFLRFLLKPLNKNNRMRIMGAFLIIALIWVYALLTGFSPSVCRATTMLSFVVLGRAFQRSASRYNLVAISAFLLLLYNPLYLFDVGFQLSYLAVIGLIYFQPKIYRMIYFKNKLLQPIWNYAALALAAQLVTFPISIYYFHQFPLYFLLSNVLIALPVVLLMYGGVIFLLVPFTMILKPLGLILNGMILLMNAVLQYIQALPFAHLGGLWINTGQCVLLYLIMGCFALLLFQANRKVFFAFIGLVVILLMNITYQLIQNQNRHELIFFSLKKDAVIAHLSRGQGTVIGIGSLSNKTLDFFIRPALLSKGTHLVKRMSFGDTAQSATYRVSSNWMQFGWFRILRWTSAFDSLRYTRQIRVDALLLSGNPKVKLSEIRNTIDFSVLLIDGTNKSYCTRRWEEEAKQLQIPYHILNGAKAFVVKL